MQYNDVDPVATATLLVILCFIVYSVVSQVTLSTKKSLLIWTTRCVLSHSPDAGSIFERKQPNNQIKKLHPIDILIILIQYLHNAARAS